MNKLYEKNLEKISKQLNKYHSKNYSIRFWRIIIGKWLYRIICCAYERYNSIQDIEKNYKQLKFISYKYNFKDFIPCGIEDFNYLIGTHSWNEYIYSEIIDKCEIKKIEKINKDERLNISEFDETYKRLTVKRYTFKGKVYSKVLDLFSNFNKTKNYLIFDSYLKKQDELNLNYKLNKNPMICKSPSFNDVLSIVYPNKNFSALRNITSNKKFNNFEDFIEKFIIQNIPKTYLEYFEKTLNYAEKLKLPQKPKVIFTTRGINRSTLMDYYIASKIINGSKLLIAQHGGNYGQHKGHWGSVHEIKMSDKFLSWGNKETKKIIPFGLIKKMNTQKYKKDNKMILFETRNRLLYSHEFKVDQGAINSKIYYENMKSFFSLIKEKKILKNFFIKTNPKDFGWNEKSIFKKCNKNIKFMSKNYITSDSLKNSRIVIYSFPSSGHLECIYTNTPMLMFYFNDLNLMEKETKIYFKKFIKLGIIHTNPHKMYKKLKEVYDDPYSWWYSKKVQKVIKDYSQRFCKENNDIVDNLLKIIKIN